MHDLERDDALGHVFTHRHLLHQALTHRSHGQPHNERLEFVGDAVLNCVIAAALFDRHPVMPEGELSRLRSSLVNQTSLAEQALRINLGGHLLLGEGEVRSGGASRPSMLADALEALFGAVFLDAGYDRAQAAILRLFEPALATAQSRSVGKDAKTSLQEWLQARRMPLPEYRVTGISGEAHSQMFEVECVVDMLAMAQKGRGVSRRAAEQSAAQRVLEEIVKEGKS